MLKSKFFVFLFFVGIVEVIQKFFSKKLRFLRSESIGYVEIESTEFFASAGCVCA